MYHNFLEPLVRRRCGGGTVRMLEIGLGCGSYALSKGAHHGAGAGGSAMGWLSLFPADLIRFDFHIMEYDKTCAMRWATKHPEAAVRMHIGNQGNRSDLARLFEDSGGVPFDIVIDDGSHLNEHQRFTLNETLSKERVARGGIYVVEDAISACKNFAINEPKGADYAYKNRKGFRRTGGAGPSCSDHRKGTIFDLAVEHQRLLLQRSLPLPHVRQIAMFEEAVAYKLS